MSVVIPDCTSCEHFKGKNERDIFVVLHFQMEYPKNIFGEIFRLENYLNVQIILNSRK